MAVIYVGLGTDSSGNLAGTPSEDAGYGAGAFSWATRQGLWLGDHNWTLCPGSGNQDIQEISWYVNATTGSPVGRLAIYSADGSTLMAYGTSTFTIVAGPSWQGHMSAAAITQNAPLVGGTKYLIVKTASGGTPRFSIYSNSDQAANYEATWAGTEWTSGFPTPLTTESGGAGSLLMARYSVQPAGGAAGQPAARRFRIVSPGHRGVYTR